MSHITFKVNTSRGYVSVTMPAAVIQLVEAGSRGEETKYSVFNAHKDEAVPYTLEPSEFRRVKELLENPLILMDHIDSVPTEPVVTPLMDTYAFNKVPMHGCAPLGNPDEPSPCHKDMVNDMPDGVAESLYSKETRVGDTVSFYSSRSGVEELITDAEVRSIDPESQDHVLEFYNKKGTGCTVQMKASGVTFVSRPAIKLIKGDLKLTDAGKKKIDAVMKKAEVEYKGKSSKPGRNDE